MDILRYIIPILLTSAGAGSTEASAPADSISSPYMLDEITIESASNKIISLSAPGEIHINARSLYEQPSFMGGSDPITLIRTLPSVQTAAELRPGIFVRGSGNGSNLFLSDGAPLANPMHMLGLYSTFNPDFYKSYSFSPGYIPAHYPETAGGLFSADSGIQPDSILSGTLSVGLIESHTAIRIPVSKRASVAIAARRTYLNLIFPDILRLGDSSIRYAFTDANVASSIHLSDKDFLRLSFFFNRDCMNLHSDKDGAKSGNFGWGNIAASATWIHDSHTTTASFSRFNNRFQMEEAGRCIDLPSSLTQSAISHIWEIRDFTNYADFVFRNASGQHNKALQTPAVSDGKSSLELNVASDWNHKYSFFDIKAGLRLSLYHCRNYNTIIPQPRITLTMHLRHGLGINVAYSRLVKFYRLVEETTGGLPADFFICAGNRIRPEDIHSFEISTSGSIPYGSISFSIGAYYKIMKNQIEFTGALLDLTSPSFRPLENIASGNGYACGLSLSLMRQIGRLRGRIGYNIGTSKIKSPVFGSDYYPAPYDRLHDLNINISYSPSPRLTFAANFTYATGTPYTEAKYGYMIGENLICEYFPHNSSRLPDYSRLDLSANWIFLHRGNIRHSLNFSVYNALATRNTLFVYTDYSTDLGIRHRKSVMKNIIPSITYTLNF